MPLAATARGGAKPRIYVHRAGVWASRLLDPTNLARLASFAEVVSDADRLEPMGRDEVSRRLTGVRAILSLNGHGAEDLPPDLLEEMGSLELVCIAHYWGLSHFGDLRRRGRVRVVEGSEIGNIAVAEWIVAASLAHVRQLHVFDQRLKAGSQWGEPRRKVGLLHGRTVGLIGFGRIGRVVARYFQALGVRTVVSSRSLDPTEAARAGVILQPLENVVTADFIVPLQRITPSTAGILSRELLWRIRTDAVLINAGRSAAYNEDDLLQALSEHRFSAVLDVFDVEPLPVDHPFRHLPNVMLTPHIAGNNSEMFRRCTQDAIELLRSYFDSGRIPDLLRRTTTS